MGYYMEYLNQRVEDVTLRSIPKYVKCLNWGGVRHVEFWGERGNALDLYKLILGEYSADKEYTLVSEGKYTGDIGDISIGIEGKRVIIESK